MTLHLSKALSEPLETCLFALKLYFFFFFFTIAGNVVKILERVVWAFKLLFFNIKSHCSSLNWLVSKYCPHFFNL